MTRTPYEILGVSESATADEIKKAYRKKARENHPDLHPDDPHAAERMNEINEAYDRLSNPDKYAERDRRQRAAQQQQQRSSSGYGYGTSGGSGYSSGSAGSSSGGYSSGQGSAGSGYRGGYSTGYSGQGGRQGSGDPFSSSGPYGWAGDFGFGWEDFFDFSGFSSAPVHPEASASDSPDIRRAIDLINAQRYAEALKILNAVTSVGRNARWHYLVALANHGAGNKMLALDQIRKAIDMDPANADYKRAYNNMKSTGATYQQDTQTRGFTMSYVNPFALCCGCMLISTICFPGMVCLPCII